MSQSIAPPRDDSHDAAAASRERFKRQALGGYGAIAGLLATIALIWFIVSNEGKPATIALGDARLSINAHGYGADIAVADIQDVQLVRQLTGIGNRRNAYQWGSVYHGSFDVTPYGTALLFVDAKTPPFVLLRTARSVVLINTPDSLRTLALFDSLATRTHTVLR